MFINYLKIAFRIIKRHKGYSFINIAGLAIGIACCMLIIFYVAFELSYDNYHKDVDRIYRIGLDRHYPWEKNICASVGYPIAAYLKKNIPQVEYAGRIRREGNVIIKKEGEAFYENNFFSVDNDIFNIFTIPFIRGNAEQALQNPGTIVISQSIANKYFGEEDPLGRTLTINSNNYQITGIVKNPPLNTHFKYSIFTLLNDSSLPESIRNSFTPSVVYTYLKLAPNNNNSDFIARIMNKALEDHVDMETHTYFLQPLKDIHLHSHLLVELEPPGNPFYLYIFSIIAVLILMIACINFINLSTASSANRAKEIGIRKVVGAFRNQLINQFIGESLFITILSAFAAFILVMVLLPFFNRLTDIQFTVSDFFKLELLISLILVILFSGIIAGSYPAIFLSAFKPTLILKGKLRSGTKRSTLRKIMVIGQFTISLILIISTMTIYKQVRFMKNEKLGFSKEQKLIIPVRGANLSKNYETVKSEFLKHSRITGATVSNSIPGRITTSETYRLFNEKEDEGQQMKTLFIDKDFIPEYGIELAAGRIFYKEINSRGETEFLINETAVRALGLPSPQDAIGKRLVAWGGGRIVGVVKDFHFQGLQQEIEPLVLTNYSWMFSFVTVSLSTEEVSQTLSFAQAKWKELFPGIPYEYYFLDEDLNRLYRSEEKTGALIGVFALMGVLIACLGLFGLISFTAEQKTKEIGIRKVLGASVSNILLLLTKEFAKCVLIANIIAWPIAYYAMHRWLQGFAYRINIGLLTFILSAALALIIALLTVSYQAIKSAYANPVESLRYE